MKRQTSKTLKLAIAAAAVLPRLPSLTGAFRSLPGFKPYQVELDSYCTRACPALRDVPQLGEKRETALAAEALRG